MLDDMTQMIKEKLLEDLISQMSEGHAGRLMPKGMGVEVQASSKDGLEDGLDKAKSLMAKGEMPEDHEAGDEAGGDDDEQRLLELLEDEENEEGH